MVIDSLGCKHSRGVFPAKEAKSFQYISVLPILTAAKTRKTIRFSAANEQNIPSENDCYVYVVYETTAECRVTLKLTCNQALSFENACMTIAGYIKKASITERLDDSLWWKPR